MNRPLRLAFFSAAVASLVVFALSFAGYAGDVKPLSFGSLVPAVASVAITQDPAPAPAPVVTVGDLISNLASAKQTQSAAQATRDAAAKALADADAALATQAQAVATADTAIKSALTAVGPIIVNGVVYEPTADGGYRSFTPATADTPVPANGPVPAPPAGPGVQAQLRFRPKK